MSTALYAAEKAGGRSIRITADGTLNVFALGIDDIEGVAFDAPNGDLYVGEVEKSTPWRVRRRAQCPTVYGITSTLIKAPAAS